MIRPYPESAGGAGPASGREELPASDPKRESDGGAEALSTLRAERQANADRARWFAENVQPREPSLRSYLRRAFPAVRDVDDVVQECYARVWSAQAVSPIHSVQTFLIRVARNLAIDLVRRERASPIQVIEDLARLPAVADGPGIAELFTREEKAALLGSALAELPDRCREVVFLHKIKGFSQREVGEQLGLSEKTVANQIAKGVKRCQAYFQRRGVEFF